MADNFTYDFAGESHLISKGSNGWNLELNLISWNGRPAKFDIRSWSEDHQKMGKGVTLTQEDLKNLRDILNQIQL